MTHTTITCTYPCYALPGQYFCMSGLRGRHRIVRLVTETSFEIEPWPVWWIRWFLRAWEFIVEMAA